MEIRALRAARSGQTGLDAELTRIEESTRQVLRQSREIMSDLRQGKGVQLSLVGEAQAIGADGFVDKGITFEEMVAPILVVSPVDGESRRRGDAQLSIRELEVLKHVAVGLSNKQIARRLGISEKTVRNHLSRVFSKLQATNRTEAVMTAMRLGIAIT